MPNRVFRIEYHAFYNCTSLTNMVIPSSVSSIVDFAFERCTNLAAAYFQGNAPADSGNQFLNDPIATVYYLPGSTCWGLTFGSAPAVLWNPQAKSPGFQAGDFGFAITGPKNATIVVEACANLSAPIWLPVATNTLDAVGVSAFSDAETSRYSSRFYRFRSP